MPRAEENTLNDYEQEKLVSSYADITVYKKVKYSLDCLCAFTILEIDFQHIAYCLTSETIVKQMP